MRPIPRPATLLLLLLVGCGPSPLSPSSAPSSAPNVVLVTLDTTRPDYFSCYGGANPTPHFDALAAQGVRFERALSASAVTPVSHATILTGRFPYEHGLRVLSAGSGFRLPADQPTLATVLKGAGYRTGAVHSAFPVSGYFGFARDFDFFESFDGALEMRPGAIKTTWDTRLQRRSDHTTDLCLDFLRRARAGGRPFFLWVHYWDPHGPNLKPPPEYLSHLDPGDARAGTHDPAYQQFYATEVRFMDRQFGRLMDGLRDEGLRENTLVAVIADHGEGLADGFRRHGWSRHRMNYQEQLHVPLILAGPGVGKGATVAEMVRTVDLAPTLLDYAGLVLEGASGRSLRPLVEGRPLEPALAYADHVNGYDHNAGMVEIRPDAAFLFTVCDGRWKLTWRPHMPEASELFDLAADPRERRNQIATQPEVVARLMADLAARDPWVLEPFPDDGSDSSADVSGALRELGYAGGGGRGDLDWWWTCPLHLDHRRAERSSESGSPRHDEDGCSQPVVPCTEWER